MIEFKRYFLLNEISETSLKKITSNIPPDQLPFGEIFGDNYRIEEEFLAVHPVINQLKNKFKEYDIDILSGTIKRKNSTNSQKLTKFITREYDKLFNSVYPEIKRNFGFDRQDPTGYMRELFPVFAKEKNYKLRPIQQYQTPDWLTVTSEKGSKEIYEEFKEWIQTLDNHPKLRTILYNFPRIFREIASNRMELIQNNDREITFAFEYIQKLVLNYHIIYSRHPIDILRMSDYQGIQSCHSQGGGYFDCAVQEAQRGGLIAYLVNDKQFKEIKDLQAKEIFADKERSIEGVQPDGRVRLRLYSNGNQSIFIPEDRIYGKHTRDNIGEEFHDKVLEWSKNVQGIDENFKFTDSQNGEVDLNDWELIGGYYEDTSSQSLFSKMFPDIEFSGEVGKRDSEMHRAIIIQNEWEYFINHTLTPKLDNFEIEYFFQEQEGNEGVIVDFIGVGISVDKFIIDNYGDTINDGYYIIDLILKEINKNLIWRGDNILFKDPCILQDGVLYFQFDLTRVWNHGIDSIMEITKSLFNIAKNHKKVASDLLDLFEWIKEYENETGDVFFNKDREKEIELKHKISHFINQWVRNLANQI